MVLKELLLDGIKRPFSNLKAFLIGLLFFSRIPFLVIFTGIIAFGYLLRAGELYLKGKKELPAWDDFFDLVVRGLKGYGIIIIYLLPLFVLGIILTLIFELNLPKVSQTFYGFISYYQSLNSLIGLTSILITLLFFISYIVPMYLLPIAILKFAKTNNFKKALNVKDIIHMSLSTDYLLSWILLMLIPLGLFSLLPALGIEISLALPTAPLEYFTLIGIYFIIALVNYYFEILSITMFAGVLKKELK